MTNPGWRGWLLGLIIAVIIDLINNPYLNGAGLGLGLSWVGWYIERTLKGF